MADPILVLPLYTRKWSGWWRLLKWNVRGFTFSRILLRQHFCFCWAIFLRKWAKRGRYSNGNRYRAMLNKNWRGGYRQLLVSAGRRYVPHSRSYTRYFAFCFWRSHYQPQNWCRLSTSELRFDTVGLLFVGCTYNKKELWENIQ